MNSETPKQQLAKSVAHAKQLLETEAFNEEARADIQKNIRNAQLADITDETVSELLKAFENTSGVFTFQRHEQ